MPTSTEPEVDGLIYRVDAQERITFVNRQWDDFALANGATELTGEAVLGRGIPEFIAGAEALHLYKLVTLRARQTGQVLTFSFRCDAPDEIRVLRMRVELVAGDQVEFRTSVLETQRRPPVTALLAGARHGAALMLRLCSWCNRGEVDGQWVEIDRIMTSLHLFDGLELPQVTHGLCVDCHRQVLADCYAD